MSSILGHIAVLLLIVVELVILFKITTEKPKPILEPLDNILSEGLKGTEGKINGFDKRIKRMRDEAVKPCFWCNYSKENWTK